MVLIARALWWPYWILSLPATFDQYGWALGAQHPTHNGGWDVRGATIAPHWELFSEAMDSLGSQKSRHNDGDYLRDLTGGHVSVAKPITAENTKVASVLDYKMSQTRLAILSGFTREGGTTD